MNNARIFWKLLNQDETILVAPHFVLNQLNSSQSKPAVKGFVAQSIVASIQAYCVDYLIQAEKEVMSSDNKPKGADNECIQVVVRCRPLNKKENEEKRLSIIDIDIEARQVSIKNPDNLNEAPKYFTYDAAYDENTQQRIFYDESCFNVIEGTLEGFNSTIFAYGQTGCGKSFTMQGPSTTIDNLKGVIPNSFSHIFQFVKASKDIVFLIRCSYLELYNEEIKDLLSNAKQQGEKCELKEDPQKGVYVKGLTTVVVESADDLNKMLDRGLLARTTAATNMNAESSRSHSIFTIIVEMNTKDATTGKDMLRVGKLNLVDLAGSERQKKTGAKDATLKEGIKINLSLSALGNVISALSEGSRHIPYRDSKLTRLLQDSLGGNTKTMMIAAISPADYNYEETMSTLRYANRAKNIKNKPKINEDPKDTMIREFKEEIERLRSLLAAQAAGGGSGAGAGQALQAMAAMMGQMAPAGPSGEAQGGRAEADHGGHASSTSGNNSHAAAAGSPKKQKDKEHHHHQSPARSNAEDEQAGYSPDKDHFSHTYSSHGGAGVGGALESLGSEEGAAGAHSARERTLEDVESRLHQLEGMLVSNHDGEMGHSLKASSALNTVGSEIMAQPWAPTEEEIAEEEEAARVYQMRRNQALKKKEAQQEREMARILEERRAMEEELEELRLSTRASSSAAGNVTQGLHGTVAGSGGNSNANSGQNNLGAAVAEVQAAMAKKLGRMKKKYEKKLAAAKEALEDLQADFSYERKQFADAAAEQEKDVRLYELICQSVLSDKDLKRIIEKCRYDEEADEWIVPFTKKKNISDSQWQQAESASAGASSSGGGNRSLFPDIGGAPNNMSKGSAAGGYGNGNGIGNGANNNTLQALGSTLRDPSKMNGNKSSGGGGSKDSSEGRPSPVPLLTLPGNLTTTASLISPAGPYQGNSSSGGGGGSKQDKGGFLPQISSRSDVNTGRNAGPDPFEHNNNTNSAFSQLQILPAQGLEKKKKPKNKVPKSQGNPSSGMGAGVGYALSSARSQGDEYVDITDNDLSGGSSSVYAGASSGVAENKENGNGNGADFAGPVEDWGFVYDPNQLAAHGPGQGGNGPELEYSDDEDFESTEDIISSSQYKSHDGPYPPAYGSGSNPAGAPRRKGGGKKKKKAAQEEASNSTNSKGTSSFALPPI